MLLRFSFLTASAVGLAACKQTIVYAAASESAKVTEKKKIRPSELPIYGEPEALEVEFVPEPETSFHQKVSAVRKWTWSYLDSVQDKTDLVRGKYETAKAHSTEALRYLQEDSSALPRIAVITVAGLGGIVAGYKGGKIKKTFLATLSMTAAASVCYPREAVEIGGAGWQAVINFVKQTYRENFLPAQKRPTQLVELEESNENVNENVSTVLSSAVQGDVGMSNPADKDMYTTRDG